jgi:hypothetical protein
LSLIRRTCRALSLLAAPSSNSAQAAIFEDYWSLRARKPLYQTYLAATAISTAVKMTNAAVCSQKLSAKGLLKICTFIAGHLPSGAREYNDPRENDATEKGRTSRRVALLALPLPSLSPCMLGSCRCVVQETRTVTIRSPSVFFLGAERHDGIDLGQTVKLLRWQKFKNLRSREDQDAKGLTH